MHREISYADSVFTRSSSTGLYALTALLVGLILRDQYPMIAGWSAQLGLDLPQVQNTLFGLRYALLAAVLGGARILYGSLDSLFAGRLGADLAVAIACIAALLMNEPLIAAEVVIIAMIGECLEAFTYDRTQAGIRKLVEVFPRKCWKIVDGEDVAVETDTLQVGDHVRIKPGKKVPVDGLVLEGFSTLDTSPLTGESLPREVTVGDTVLAGCLNQNGMLIVEVGSVKGDTFAGKIIEFTAKALQDRPQVVRQADRIAKWFLPVLLGVTVFAFLGNLVYHAGWFGPAESRLSLKLAARQSLYPTLGVLVVACPCALILATPAAMVAALGRLAGTGILVKSAAALEQFAQVKMIAFDKTGTLTTGQLSLQTIITQGVSEDRLLALAAAVEQNSEHPFARAIMHAAKERGLSLPTTSDFQASPGGGVQSQVDGLPVLIGNVRFLSQHQIALPPEFAAQLAQWDERGHTVVLVARQGQVLGMLTASDTTRPSAHDVVAELRTAGIEQFQILSGDRRGPVERLANDLNIVSFEAELLPLDKANRIVTPATTAYVGDGINDAPALAHAGVGLAVGSGTDVAAEAGSIVLLGDPLRHLPLLYRLSKQTLTIIRQNILWFAIGLNLVGVLLTGFLWPLLYSGKAGLADAPLVGVIYHQLASLAVLANSMRLLLFERPRLSRFGTQVSHQVQRVDLMISSLQLDDLLHWISHQWRRVLKWVVPILVLVWLGTGITIVPPAEVAVVQRFGRYEHELSPGLHWIAPYPIDRCTFLRPQEIRVVELGYRSEQSASGFTWDSAHQSQSQRMNDESTMITGDGYLLDMAANLRFQIHQPTQFLQVSEDIVPVVRSTLESVIREIIASRTFVELLTTERLTIETEVLVQVQQRLKKIHENGLGIRLEGLTIHDIHPPQEVVASFHRVATAIQEKQQKLNEANSLATRKRSQAEEEAIRILGEAEAISHERLRMAEAWNKYSQEWQNYRTLLSEMDRKQHPTVEEQQKLIAVRHRVSEYRQTLAVLTEILQKRDKVLIDGDLPKGRRTYYLVNPDFLKPIISMPRPSPTPEEP
ncbi:MAG: cation-translocating P-type ATPase family protein [Zavarzinella sp.]